MNINLLEIGKFKLRCKFWSKYNYIVHEKVITFG